ncbi:MAG: S41 family peptidase [Candidatus Taylorbacteria bacterium]
MAQLHNMDINRFSNKTANVILAMALALAVGFGAGWYFRSGKTVAVISINSAESPLTNAQFAPFWNAWNILNNKYISTGSTTDQEKVWGSIKGLASSFNDPYTVFFPPEESKIFQDNISGNFGGVGMEIGKKDGQLLVVAPIKDSPAAVAGVKSGDFILSINSTSTVDMSVDQAVALIRGPQGTKVKMSFLPKGANKAVERTITRDIIKIPTLDTETKDGGIFVIKLYSFTSQSPNLFREALRQLIASGDHKLILDLRGNPGGYLDAAWDMSSYFLPIGKVVVSEDFGAHGQPNIFRSKGYDVFGDKLNMLILVDSGSASASEILAGALQENSVAKLVGSKTFGKGSVQELIPVTPESSLKVTIAHWLTPNGHNLSHDGLEPDYPVTLTDKQVAAAVAAGTDPVMDKAVSILNSTI